MAMLVHMSDPAHWLSPLRSRLHLQTYEPTLRMLEDEHSYKVVAAVPGVPADGVSVSVTDDGLLKVHAKSKADGREVLNKTLRLAEDADANAVSAICTDGMLEVTVNKMQPPAPMTVTVQAAEPPSVDAEQRAWVITKKLPGLAAPEISLSLEPRGGRATNMYQLVIHAVSAKGYGEFHFSQTIPEDAVPENATAYCCNGLLHVRIPRREPALVTVPVASSEDETSADDQQLVKFMAPGYSAEHVKLQATPGCLHVKLQREPNELLERLVVLPDEVKDLNSLRAVCVDGVLKVKAPKAALRHQATAREIELSAGSCIKQ